jgi:kynurenine 3-monooxygenase
LLPYAEAFARGQIQQDILDQLVANTDSIEGVDFDKAEKLIAQQLSPVELD